MLRFPGLPAGPLAALVVAALLLTASAPLAAQAPGYQQLDTRQIVAEYNAEVLSHLNELMVEWGRAWANDDLESLADLYWENAVLVPFESAPARGRMAIQSYLQGLLPLVGAAEAFMLDFDASGSMATVFGNYMIERQTGPQAGTSMTGPIITVYKREGRTWRIRSQVFVGESGS